MPGRVSVVRPGLIVGPLDHTDRFTYWITRVADRAHPRMVIPEKPESIPMQVIDARDLARFTLDRAEARDPEVYNATGPDYPLTLSEVLRTAERVTGHAPDYVEVPEARLLEGGVQPWVDLPLWLPSENADLHRIGVERAINAGLRYRPLAETMADIYAWRQSWGEPQRAGWSREREKAFLN
jgi:2'-hydroxyisoflavone reductase